LSEKSLKKLRQNQQLFRNAAWQAENSYRKGNFNSAMAWAKIAAHFAFVRHPGFYVDLDLENVLLNVANKIEGSTILNQFSPLKPKNGKKRFLHVVTESYGTGGHSQFIARWIGNTSDSAVHSIVTTAQNSQMPEMLSDAVTESGGWCCSIASFSSDLFEQAAFLRQLATDWADVIVLFVHPFDPLPLVAFGKDGGPPVIFVNHADHAFWLGASIADLTVDYHVLGGVLSAKRRGLNNSKVLPIPLEKTAESPKNMEVRRELGVGDDEVMVLTVGRDEKFTSFGDYDFLRFMVDVLKRHPTAKLYGVGPTHSGKWQEASGLTDGRIKALGPLDKPTLDTLYQAADVYVASFPCGSETAMLEAGLHGIPMRSLYIEELPHFSGCDDVAFEKSCVTVASLDSLASTLDGMIEGFEEHRQKALWVKEIIQEEHCMPGWNRHLDAVLQALPKEHSVQKIVQTSAEVDTADVFFEQMCASMMHDELPEHSLERLIRVYQANIPRAEARRVQASTFLAALPKVNSVKRCKDYLYNLREYLQS
jgi:hypothetical protein